MGIHSKKESFLPPPPKKKLGKLGFCVKFALFGALLCLLVGLHGKLPSLFCTHKVGCSLHLRGGGGAVAAQHLVRISSHGAISDRNIFWLGNSKIPTIARSYVERGSRLSTPITSNPFLAFFFVFSSQKKSARICIRTIHTID